MWPQGVGWPAWAPPDRSAPALSLSFLLLKTDYWGPSPNVCWKILLPSDDWAIFRTSACAGNLQTLGLGRRPHGGCNYPGFPMRGHIPGGQDPQGRWAWWVESGLCPCALMLRPCPGLPIPSRSVLCGHQDPGPGGPSRGHGARADTGMLRLHSRTAIRAMFFQGRGSWPSL